MAIPAENPLNTAKYRMAADRQLNWCNNKDNGQISHRLTNPSESHQNAAFFLNLKYSSGMTPPLIGKGVSCKNSSQRFLLEYFSQQRICAYFCFAIFILLSICTEFVLLICQRKCLSYFALNLKFTNYYFLKVTFINSTSKLCIVCLWINYTRAR